MKKIADVHVHIRHMQKDIVEKMLEDISAEGVTDVCIQALAYRGVGENLAALYLKQNYKKINIRVFGNVHQSGRYSKIPFEIQARKLIELGCDGIKLMFAPNTRKYFGLGVNDIRYDSMFAYLEENKIPVLIHVNDPEEFWDTNRRYSDGSFLTKQQIYDEMFEVLDRYPKLQVTFAHFFFLSNFPEEAERIMQSYPKVV